MRSGSDLRNPPSSLAVGHLFQTRTVQLARVYGSSV